jgi:hypothetical protein
MTPYASVQSADETSCTLTNADGYDVACLERVTARVPRLPAEHHLTPKQWQDMINLVNAAPDLLEALQTASLAMKGIRREITIATLDALCDAEDAVDAAIQKATLTLEQE